MLLNSRGASFKESYIFAIAEIVNYEMKNSKTLKK